MPASVDGGARVFTYGTLLFDSVWSLVAGSRHATRPATLPGFRRCAARGRVYPVVLPAPGHEVSGLAYENVGAAVLARLDAFEGDEYERRSVPVTIGDGLARAWVYVLRPDHHALALEQGWDPDAFTRDHLGAYLARHRDL